MCTSFRLDPAQSARIRALIDEIFGRHPTPEQRVVQERLFDCDLHPNDLILTLAGGVPADIPSPHEGKGRSERLEGWSVPLSETGMSDAPFAATLMRWGLPGFKSGRSIVNARSESAAEKPLFADALASRRCLVPATGFYEWDAAKRRYRFSLPDADELYMAAFFSPYRDGPRCCILTTSPNASVVPIHDRMPVVLGREQLEPWLYDDDAVAGILASRPPVLEVTSAPSARQRGGGSGGAEQPTLW